MAAKTTPAPETRDALEVTLAKKMRALMLLHKQRSGIQAELIRMCLARIIRSPDDVPHWAGYRDMVALRKKIRDERAQALAALARLADMLEKDAANEGDT